MEECINCRERWFDMDVNDAKLCSRCRKPKQADIFNKSNNLDPGPSIQELAQQYGMKVPEKCTQIEAMCISGVLWFIIYLLISRFMS
jgi:hypothetical protein